MGLRQVRLEKRMTQKELADAIGVDHTVVSKYEKGLVAPPYNRLKAMAEVLGVNIEDLTDAQDSGRIEEDMGSPIDEDKRRQPESEMRRCLITYSKGICDLCGKPAPFRTEDGMPYLEFHYIKWLSKGGSLTFDNIAVLCPNCHTRVHMLRLDEDEQYLRDVARNRALKDGQ
ncbi:MAG: helix-turn-helix domain-containing protein [Lachnospiraceae bacterium]|nr:helix-turn-helix domain-containing protein [Lachnospiraceae bacterium]